MSKETKLYQFYSTSFESKGLKNIVGTKTCKYPERTKIYKILTNKLNREQIETFGYEQIIMFGFNPIQN